MSGRITLVSSNSPRLCRRWRTASPSDRRLIFTPARLIPHALEFDQDVERIILDSGAAADYLALLSTLPVQFAGDALLIQADDTGFLSAMSRGGGRVLYALRAADIHFYLAMHELIASELSSRDSQESTDIEVTHANNFDR